MSQQFITSPGLLGTPHYRNSRVSMSLMEPIYKSKFTAQIDLPAALSIDQAGTNLFLEEVTKVGGLDTNKVPQPVTQGYKYAKRSFAGGTPGDTFIDVTLGFETNLDYSGEDGKPHSFVITTLRKWTDLIYDPLTGNEGLKKDYVADQMVITMQDRAGTPYWQWVLYNIFPTKGIGDPGLDYNSNDILKLDNMTFRCDYYDEFQL